MKVSVFGPGTGEAIILEVPGIGWGLIDSCTAVIEGKKVNPPLEYLKQNKVEKLAFIILTHPHEDHYLGLDEIIDAYLSKIELICFYSGSGIKEYAEYLVKKELLHGRGARRFALLMTKIKEASTCGAKLLRISERTEIIRKNNYGGHEIEIISLSPSAESMSRYVARLFDAIPKNSGDTIKPLDQKDINLISCAIWISIDNSILILGGDVETGIDDTVGWRAIIRDPCRELGCALVKVPHHGSLNAYHKEAWEKFAEKSQPIAIITPYISLSNPLPRTEELDKIFQHSRMLAITSRHSFLRPKKVYDREIVKHLYGVKEWKCINDEDKKGYLEIELNTVNGAIENVALHSSAYLYDKSTE